MGGVAVGTAIGATVATAAAPVYYSYPAPVYAPPVYAAAVAAPGAVVAVGPVPAAYYGPRVVYAAPYPFYPCARLGCGWGPRHYYGGRHYRWR